MILSHFAQDDDLTILGKRESMIHRHTMNVEVMMIILRKLYQWIVNRERAKAGWELLSLEELPF